MTQIRNKILTVAFLLAFGGLQAATGAVMTVTPGNNAAGFNNGDTPALVRIPAAQAAQPEPFGLPGGYATLPRLELPRCADGSFSVA